MKDLNKIKEFFSKSLKEMEFGDPLEQIFMNYAGKTIEMEFDDPNSDWSNLIGDLEEYFPGDKLSDFMSSKELEIYLDDYNIRLIDPIMDREVDPSIVKRGKAKMDIDAMRKAANLPPLDDPISMNEGVLVMDDTITPDMWDKEKIKVGIQSKKINNPSWFTKPHKIIDFNSRMGMISFDHPAKQKLSLNWVNSFLKDNHKVDMSAEPEGYLSTKYAKSRMNEEKSFTDYSNNELAAYCKNNPTDKKAAKELHKRSQALKGLSRTDINEGAEEIMDAYNDVLDLVKKHSRRLNDDDSYALGLKLRAWFEKNIIKESINEGRDITDVKPGDIIIHDETGKEYKVQDLIGKIHRLQSNKLKVVDTEGNVRVINPYKYSIKENKPVANVNKHIKAIQIQLDDLGVKYEMSDNPYKPFKAIYKPVNKDDEWYDNFNDIVFRYNLKDVVKTSMNEATEDAIYYLQQAIKLSHTNTVRKLILKAIRELGLEVPKVWTESTNASVSEADKKKEKQLAEAKYSEYADLIDLVNKADNPRNLPIYYNSDFGVVNIGGVGYDKGELVNMFNSQPGTSVDIKNTFFRANQNPEQTAKDVNSLNMGVKAEVDYGYGKEPFIKFTKGYSDDFLDQEMKTQMSNDEETLRRERGLEEIKQRVFNKLKK